MTLRSLGTLFFHGSVKNPSINKHQKVNGVKVVTDKFRVVSLFSGAGGLDLGFKLTGKYTLLFANEILTAPSKTFANNFGVKLETCEENSLYDAMKGYIYNCDVSQVDFRSLRDAGVDVVIGGPPCQDFSIVRGPSWDRRGIEVKRGKLYSHFVRALVQIQPKIFVFENVPGLKSANRGVAYKVILEDFEKLNIRWSEIRRSMREYNDSNHVPGYEIVFSDIVDFSSFGIPQKRERLIIIGIRKDLIRDYSHVSKMSMKARKRLKPTSSPFKHYPLTTIETFEGDILPNTNEQYRKVMLKWDGVWREVKTERAFKWKSEVWDRLTFDAVKDYIMINKLPEGVGLSVEEAFSSHKRILRELNFLGRPVSKIDPPDNTNTVPNESEAVVERMKRIPPDENHEFVKGTRWEVRGKGISLIYRRIHPLKPSYTMVAYGGGGTHGYHYDRDRASLTLREKARLQTFPDSFLFYGNRSQIRAQISEAVPPLAGRIIGELVYSLINMLAEPVISC